MRTMWRSLVEDEVAPWPVGSGEMVRSRGVKRVEAAVWVGEVFVSGKMGLDVALKTEVLEELVFSNLLEGLEGLPDGFDYSAVPSSTDADDKDNDDDDDSAKKTMSNGSDVLDMNAVQSLTKEIIDILLRRASNPTRNMKKRAKRKYLKQLKCCQGPSAHTIDLAVKICVHGDMEGGVGKAREILDGYAKTAFLGTVQEGTVTIVEEAEERMMMAKKKIEEEKMVAEDGEDGGEDKDDETKN